MSDEQQTQQADDPSDDRYWRNVLPSEILQPDDMMRTMAGLWLRTTVPGKFASDGCGRTYRRRIEPQQPSDSEPETIDSWEMRLAKMTQWNSELEALVAEAERSGEQVNAELQQLREQVTTLTRERDEHARKLEFARESGEMSRRQVEDEAGKVERLKMQLWDAVESRQKAERELKDKSDSYQICLQNHYKAGQRSTIDRLLIWLRPVVKVVSDHPDHSSILAVSVLEFLPQIASRLIEE